MIAFRRFMFVFYVGYQVGGGRVIEGDYETFIKPSRVISVISGLIKGDETILMFEQKVG